MNLLSSGAFSCPAQGLCAVCRCATLQCHLYPLERHLNDHLVGAWERPPSVSLVCLVGQLVLMDRISVARVDWHKRNGAVRFILSDHHLNSFARHISISKDKGVCVDLWQTNERRNFRHQSCLTRTEDTTGHLVPCF